MTFDNSDGLQAPPAPPPSWDRSQFHRNVTAPITVAPFRRNPEKSGVHALPFTSVAFVGAAILLITQGIAIKLGVSGNLDAATGLGKLLNWLTSIPFVLGAIALVRGPYRGWAIAAMMVAVMATPFILRAVLSYFGGL